MTSPAQRHFFEIPLKVGRGPTCPMPSNLIGALVVCYVSAKDHLAALQAAVTKLQIDGFVFHDMNGQIRELDPLRWHEYVASSWSEFKSHFPTQEDLLRRVEAGEIFYGPFISYESES